MNDIIIKIDTKTAKAYCENNKIGVQHANLQNKLIFEMSEKINGSAWLEYEINGTKNYAEMEDTENGYQIDIKSCLLVSNNVNVDLKITESEDAEGIPIFISTIVELDVYDSINATTEEPEYYPDWKTVADSKIAEMNQLKEDVNEAITKTNNLNIDASKSGKVATVTLTKKDATTKTVTLSDGTNLMFNWDGTRLGIKTDEDEEYTYVDLIGPQGIQGEPGTTPNLTIGTVVTGNTSSATITGTPENPILNLVLEKGETGETGATGNGVSNTEKTGTQDNVDIYTIYYTNGTTSTFTVTNSTVTNQEFEELKAEHEELVNTLPRVEGTGESITIDNTAQYKMNVVLNPSELSQDGTPTPTTPIPIKKVTGNNTIEVMSENVYQKLYKTGYLNNTGVYSFSNAGYRTIYATVKPNTKYYIRKPLTTRCIIGCSQTELSSGIETTNVYRDDEATNIEYTTDATANYINIYCYSNTEEITFDFLQNNLFIVENKKTYPINLGSLEYCKIRDYSDEISLSTGVQLFDKNNANILSGYIKSDKISTSEGTKTIYIECKGNTTYTISKMLSARFAIGTTTNVPEINEPIFDYQQKNTATNLTVTTSATAKYLCVFFYHATYDTSITEQQILDSIMINEGSTSLPWQPYGIGNWYIRRNIGKVVLDGTENWKGGNQGTVSTNFRYLYTTVPTANSNVSTVYRGISDNFGIASVNSSTSTTVSILGLGVADTDNLRGLIDQSLIDNPTTSAMAIDNWKSWLTSHNTLVYYVLATPIGEQITDTTLITQLTNLYNQIKSYKGQTNITQTNAELPFNIDASALYDLNNLISRVATLEVEV